MKRFAILCGMMMVMCAFAGLATALDPLDGSDWDKDPDQDGLKNHEEFLHGTDPVNADSDGGGAQDGWELWYNYHRAADLEGGHIISDDYIFDANDPADEGFVDNTLILIQVKDRDADPEVNDPDGDGWNNLHEYFVGTDPTNPNTDGDSFNVDSFDPDPLVSNDQFYSDSDDPIGVVVTPCGKKIFKDNHGVGQGAGSESGEGSGDTGPA
jgi:hypothetical protein